MQSLTEGGLRGNKLANVGQQMLMLMLLVVVVVAGLQGKSGALARKEKCEWRSMRIKAD